MVAAAYVGRVGGLAVALGVGSAIFLGQGVAWADDSSSSSSSESKPSASATSSSDTGGGSDTSSSSATGKPSRETTSTDTDSDTDTTSDGADPTDESNPSSGTETETEPDDDSGDAAESDDTPGDADPAHTSPSADTSTVATPRARKPQAVTPPAVDTTETAPAIQTPAPSSTTTQTGAVATGSDPATPPRASDTVAVSVASVTTNITTNTATTTAPSAAVTPAATSPKPTLLTAVVNVVTSMIDWARHSADADPGDAPQPPFLWALMAFARRELNTLFAARATNAPRSSAVAPTSLALTDAATAAVTAAAPVPSYSPWLNPQVSPSTNFVSWVTGPNVYRDNPLLANTLNRYQVYGTDVGVMWDNGMVDNPDTPWNEHQILIAVGDTFGAAGMGGRHIYNTLFRSSDTDLSDGMTIPNGEWFNGNMFGGAPLSQRYQARPIINRPSWLPGSVTLIPTAGVSVPTAVTEDTPFGTVQYVSFMSVSKWGQSGRWTTNYSAVAYSTDNGENFTVAPQSVRYNSFLSANRNFQQSAYVKGNDGYVYVYGTPNGRQGAAYLARVAEKDILDVSKYEYYKKASSGWFGSTTPARWVKGSPSSASAIIGKSGGLMGFTKPGYTVSEMSVQYNDYLKKYVVMYGDQANRIVIRTSDTPEGTWSEATVLMNQQSGGIYAPMLHPLSPSTQGTGSELYWNLSLWSDYNIMLMKTDLAKL